MQGSDVLGDEGRKALNACVKVKICGKSETRRYDRVKLLERLSSCYAYSSTSLKRFDELVPSSDEHYDIVDIHEALVKSDKGRGVEKYPKEGPESGKQRNLIDKRRADVERELEEATADPNSQLRYSWLVAQRRVRDCFAGEFPQDQWTFHCQPGNLFNIFDIYEAFLFLDRKREIAEAKRAALEQEYAEAKTAGRNVKITLPKYSGDKALNHLMDCCPFLDLNIHDVSPIKLQRNQKGAWVAETRQSYDIFDIHKVLERFDGKSFQKYAKEGPGSEELKKLIDKHRADLLEEYLKARSGEGSDGSLPEYTSVEADRRVRDCFAGTTPSDTEIFPKKEKDESDQTYDIFDIKKAIDHFDAQTFLDICKYANKQVPESHKINQVVDEERAVIQDEYDKATSNIEIEHGSGFIVHNHFIITNHHVIETYLNRRESHEIRMSNAAIDDLPCEVAHHDVRKDLALLYCPDLNLEQCEICPLQLSYQSLLPGMSIFAFGYPMSHTEETALFVNGNVSGSKRKYGGDSMIVLNCSLNSGNSGGPVLRWVNGQLKVLGVATEKHFKQILTLEETVTIERIRDSLKTRAINDFPDESHVKVFNAPVSDYYSDPKNCYAPLSLLTLKLYDALETHSQFNLSNAIPGHLVVEFVKESISEYEGEYKEELTEVVELANNVVNSL